MESLIEHYDFFLKSAGRGEEAERILSTVRFRFLFGEYLSLYFCHSDNPKPRADLRREFLQLIDKRPYNVVTSEMKAVGFSSKIRRFILKKKWLRMIWLLKSVEGLFERVLLAAYD